MYDYLKPLERRRRCYICCLKKKQHGGKSPSWWAQVGLRPHEFVKGVVRKRPIHLYKVVEEKDGLSVNTRPEVLCVDSLGSWSWNIALTKDESHVTCKECLRRLNAKARNATIKARRMEIESREQERKRKKRKTGSKEKTGRKTRKK